MDGCVSTKELNINYITHYDVVIEERSFMFQYGFTGEEEGRGSEAYNNRIQNGTKSAI